MALRDFLRARLGLWMYLVGLAQFAVVGVSLFVLLAATRPPPGTNGGQTRFVTGIVQRSVGNPVMLATEVARLHDDLHVTTTVVDPGGHVVASTAPPGSPTCRAGPDGNETGCHVASITFPDGRAGRVEFHGLPHRPSHVVPLTIFVLIVVGVSSWLLARMLSSPLRRLSAAARAFGSGDLSARAGLDRPDELGDVSRAFDEMATRVTELLRAEKELLANISHELRTPLARIRVALDIAAEGDASVARESILDIAGDLDELERLISDVLAATRLDLEEGGSLAGIPPLRRQRVDPEGLLGLAASRFRAAHPARTLRVDIAKDLPSLDGDPVLLRRVVDNLLENAHKYTDRPDAAVELKGRLEGGKAVVVEVVDHGIGISEADLARLFRPFFRADKSRTRATGGLGLGLALAKRIVEAHGGTVELTSKLHQGTRALVRIPVAAAEA